MYIVPIKYSFYLLLIILVEIHNFFNTHFKELLSISIFKTFQHCLPHVTLKKRNKRLDCAISFATVMSSSEGLPYVQHNNKNDLGASGSHSNVDSNKDENESSSNSNTKIENASILDMVPFHVELHRHAQSGCPPQHGLQPREDVHSRHQLQLRPLTRYQDRSLQYQRAPRLHHPKVPFYFSLSTFI